MITALHASQPTICRACGIPVTVTATVPFCDTCHLRWSQEVYFKGLVTVILQSTSEATLPAAIAALEQLTDRPGVR
jgi:hypothetical protein